MRAMQRMQRFQISSYPRAGLLAACLLGGCAGGGAESSNSLSGGSMPSSGAPSTTMSTGETTTGEPATSSETGVLPTGETTTPTTGSATLVTIDVAESSSSGTGGELPVPCTAVDFVFVLDNTDTMAEEQVKLIAGVPMFLAAAMQNLPAVPSYHVGVITTDNPKLVVENAVACGPYAEGATFMTQADDLAVKFECAASVGLGGDPDERPMEMLIRAIDDLDNQLGGLNPLFIRKSALLVVVLLTDEEDDHEEDVGWGSDGDPPAWFQSVITTKSGHANDVVVLSLAGKAKPNECPANQWDGKEGAELAPRLQAFTEMFTYHAFGDVCAPNYDTFLLDSIGLIVDACTNFLPPED